MFWSQSEQIKDFFLFPFLGFVSQRDSQSPFSPVSPCGCLFINGVELDSESYPGSEVLIVMETVARG